MLGVYWNKPALTSKGGRRPSRRSPPGPNSRTPGFHSGTSGRPPDAGFRQTSLEQATSTSGEGPPSNGSNPTGFPSHPGLDRCPGARPRELARRVRTGVGDKCAIRLPRDRITGRRSAANEEGLQNLASPVSTRQGKPSQLTPSSSSLPPPIGGFASHRSPDSPKGVRGRGPGSLPGPRLVV